MENNEKGLEERELKELELMNENENREFYVYVHIRLDNNTVFYVGKGTGNRAYKMSRGEGTHHDNICKACDCKVVIIKNNLTENQAFKLENKMIEYYVHTLGYGIDIEGYRDYDHKLPHLTNMDWGGRGGKKGINQSEETKQKMSESHKGRNPYENKTEEEMEEIRKKMSESHKGMHHSEETKQMISEQRKGKMAGENHPMWGKKGKDNPTYGEKNGMWGKPAPNRNKVICITTGKIFDCITDAGNYYKCNNIVPCCKEKRKYAGKLQDGTKLQWKYLKDYNNEFKGIRINPIIK